MAENAPSLENLRPALAGLIVDNEVGRKEAYATFINLVERGHIKIKIGKRNKKRNVIVSDTDFASMEKFEKRLIELMLDENGKPKLISFEDAGNLLNLFGESPEFKNMVGLAAVENGLYVQSAVDAAHQFDLEKSSVLARVTKRPGDAARGLFGLAVIVFLILVNPILLLPISIFAAGIIALALFWKKHLDRKIGEMAEADMRTPFVRVRGGEYATKYLELLDWLKKHPLSDYRWGNEFLPYAVAFGLYKDYDKFPK